MVVIFTLPERKGIYKVIQVRIDTEDYLVFDRIYHADALRGILEKQRISFETRETTDRRKIPLPRGPRYDLYGAGRVDFRPLDKTATFGSNSFDYDIGLDRQKIEEVRVQLPNWKIALSE